MSGPRQNSFFGVAEMNPAVRTAAPAVAAVTRRERPEGVREPTEGEKSCVVCGGAAPFADGAATFCRPHLPPSFMPGVGR